MLRHHLSGIKVRLILLMLLALLPLLGLILYNYLDIRVQHSMQVREDAEVLLERIGNKQNAIFSEAEKILLVLSKAPQVREFNRAECNKLLGQIIENYPSYISLTVFDRKGNLVCSGPVSDKSFNIADREHFQGAMNTGQLSLGGYVISRLLGAPTLYLAYPLYNDEGIISGTINAGLNLNWLQKFMRDQDLPADGKLTVFDTQGVILAQYPDQDGQAVGRAFPDFPALRQVVDRKASGHINYVASSNQQDYFGVYRPLYGENTTAFVALTLPVAHVYARANELMVRDLTLLFLTLVIVLALGISASNHYFLRHITTLVNATRKLRAGDLGARAQIREDKSELVELCKDFNSMADALESNKRDKKLTEDMLVRLAESSHNGYRQGYIRDLLKQLVDTSVLELGLVALFDKERRDTVQTEIVYFRGLFLDNFSVSSQGMPLQRVIEQKKFIADESFPGLFPNISQLSAMEARSFAAHCLYDHAGLPFGIVVLMGSQPLRNRASLESLLPVFSARMALELDQHSYEVERNELLGELQIAAKAFESHDGVCIADNEFRILRVNKTFTDITGYSHLDVDGQTLEVMLANTHAQHDYQTQCAMASENGSWQGEIKYRHKDGKLIFVRQNLTAVKNHEGKIINYVFHLQDISERLEAEARLRHMAYHDALTNLPNRLLLMDRLAQAIASAQRRGIYGAVMFLDIDNFKDINDSLGHSVGDRLLTEVVRKMQQVMRGEDTICRIGGDEFVIMTPNISTEKESAVRIAQDIGDKLRESISGVKSISSHTMKIQASVGVAIFPDNEADSEELLKRADIAMYHAKRDGKNTVRFFKTEMQEMLHKRLLLERELMVAHQDSQFVLHYQPQVSIAGNLLQGCEALIRWRHPLRGMLAPVSFISLLEETGMIVDVGGWVLRQACDDLKVFTQRHNRLVPLSISVNISPRQFYEKDFVGKVEETLDMTGIDPCALCLELTEGVVVHDIADTITKMETLKERGIRFSIDDFGTGYSSLNYIKRMPIDSLKIDKSFVDGCTSDHNDRAITKAIIKMAKSLDCTIVAEGVETEAQLDYLANQGCDYYQGYLFSPPVGSENFSSIISNNRRKYFKLMDDR